MSKRTFYIRVCIYLINACTSIIIFLTLIFLIYSIDNSLLSRKNTITETIISISQNI